MYLTLVEGEKLRQKTADTGTKSLYTGTTGFRAGELDLDEEVR